jgi:cytochrome b pre-mRNA-processing protein 3
MAAKRAKVRREVPVFKSLFKPRPAILAGKALYASAVEQAREPALYADLGAPDTVLGRFELYTVHVALLVRRLKGEGEQAAETAQGLFDAYLNGLDVALREIGVGDLSVGKKMKKLGRAFYGRVTAYDEGLTAGDSGAVAGLVSRTVFDGKGDAGPLANYIIEQAKALSVEPLEGLLAGKVNWKGVEA